MPNKLPLIATRGVVVFPKHKAKIIVGRKESKNALKNINESKKFKIITASQKDISKNEIKSIDDIFKVGTLVSCDTTNDLSNGIKNISVTGIKRVEILSLKYNEKQYFEVDYKIINSIEADPKTEKTFIKDISKTLDSALGNIIHVPKDVLSSMAKGVSSFELADIVAHYFPFPLIKKQELLETIDVNKRLKLIIKSLNDQTKINDIEKNIDNTVRKTIDNQHREFLLRERMKAIKEELGDISSKDNLVDEWREKLKSKKFPEYIKESIEIEISKYETTPPMAAESNVIKGYLDWIFSLPWNTYSNDSEDIQKSQKILDKYHYGLKKVKERIIEHLAVKMNTKSKTSPIITLVGPPGVGKTSLAKSIAEAIGKEFIKVSLGGVKDEAEIRGHRRTYVGAMPGKIIQAIRKAKTSNPIILLDEIDKMSYDYKGDPTSAMLEVLDPEQNKLFQDHYLELEYDLSNVMFLATANFYDQIPGPLLDRVEIIQLDQYTSEEKMEIAKSYIFSKILKENGLTKKQFQISDKVLEFIINKYTLEAGVRGLQRILNKLARKIVVKKLNNEIKKSFLITKEKVKLLLGKEQVYKEKLNGKSEIGLVNGMYFSEVGGGILPIEVTTYPSKSGEIKLTGSIKNVMKESLNIAIGYIRSNQKKFKIENFDWEKTTIQVHVPAGAIPKDGPSAGIAFTTAIISAITKKAVSKEIAFTGEITLRGKILPIGGLKEKTLGAVEAGVTKIYIPEVNKKDFDDLAKKVKNIATIIPINDYSDIYKSLF